MAKLKSKLKKLQGKIKPKSYKGEKVQTDIKMIQINGVDYVEKSTAMSNQQFSGPIKIVVLQRGWVVIGRYERQGDQCFLHEANTIRNWGTKKGLGELAKDGPQTNTVLDKCYGIVEFESLTKVLSIDVDQAKWANKL